MISSLAMQRQTWQHLIMLSVLALVLGFIAYQTRLPMRVVVGRDDTTHVRGFYYYTPDDTDQPTRWTAGNGRIIFTNPGLATPLGVTIRANAWRWDNRIYTATVTVNGSVVGTISKSNWQEWQFIVTDPRILNTDELIVGIQSDTFVPANLSAEYTDNRELGVNVDWVEIVPKNIGDQFTLPSWRWIIFLGLYTLGIYGLLRIFGMAARGSFTFALGLLVLLNLGVAFFRADAMQPLVLGAITLGIFALVTIIKPAREPNPHQMRTVALVTIVGIAALALLLRWQAMLTVPIEPDEIVDHDIAGDYASMLRSGDWAQIPAHEPGNGHPILVEFIYGLALLINDTLGMNYPTIPTLRFVAMLFGTLRVVILALLNPLAGWLAAVQTTDIKYTSTAYLEALPALSSLVAIIAFERFRRTPSNRWLVLSAIALGITGASKFIYLTAGMAIVLFLFVGQRKQPRIIVTYLLATGLAFLAFNPYLWFDPLGRFIGMFSFHLTNAAGDFVKSYARPWWYLLVSLSRRAPLVLPLVRETGPAFVLVLDFVIYCIGLVGLPYLFRRHSLYAAWLFISTLFLVIWGAKWEQYTMIIVVPLYLAAAWAIEKMCAWFVDQFSARVPTAWQTRLSAFFRD